MRVLERDLAFLAGFLERLLTTLRNTADVEGPHRQLRTGFTDRLRRDDTDGFAGVHHGTARKVTTVAGCTDAFFGSQVRGERMRIDCNASFVDGVGHAFVDQLTCGDDHLIGARTQNIVSRHTAQHTFGQRGNNLTVVDGRFGGDRTLLGAAVDLMRTMQSCATSTRRRVR